MEDGTSQDESLSLRVLEKFAQATGRTKIEKEWLLQLLELLGMQDHASLGPMIACAHAEHEGLVDLSLFLSWVFEGAGNRPTRQPASSSQAASSQSTQAQIATSDTQVHNHEGEEQSKNQEMKLPGCGPVQLEQQTDAKDLRTSELLDGVKTSLEEKIVSIYSEQSRLPEITKRELARQLHDLLCHLDPNNALLASVVEKDNMPTLETKVANATSKWSLTRKQACAEDVTAYWEANAKMAKAQATLSVPAVAGLMRWKRRVCKSVKNRGKGFHSGSTFTYWLLPREVVLGPILRERDAHGKLRALPYQMLKERGLLQKVEVKLSDAILGEGPITQIGVASYAWEDRGEPDPTGERMEKHREFLMINPGIKFFFVDYNCLPQEYTHPGLEEFVTRTNEEEKYFKEILIGGGINCLYLFAKVSVVLNKPALAKFWPQAEFFMATRKFDCRNGMSPCCDRVHLAGIQGTSEQCSEWEEIMETRWMKECRSVVQAARILADEQVKVTNMKDKEALIPRLAKLEVDLYNCSEFLGLSCYNLSQPELQMASDLLQQKINDPFGSVSPSDAQEIDVILHGVAEGFDKAVNTAQGCDLVAIMGPTGSGKSTFTNYYMGCTMELTLSEDGLLIVDVSEKSAIPAIARVGHTNISETLFPTVTPMGVGNSEVIADLPGWSDKRGLAVNVTNSINIRNVLRAARTVRLVALVSYHDVVSSRGEGIRQLVRTVGELFGDVAVALDQINSMMVGISRVPLYTDLGHVNSLENVKALFLRSPGLSSTELQILLELSKTLFIFHPTDSGDKSWLRRNDIWKATYNLEPVTNPRQVFQTILSTEDEAGIRNMLTRECHRAENALIRGLQADADSTCIVGSAGSAARTPLQHFEESAAILRHLMRIRVVDNPRVDHVIEDCVQMVNTRIQKLENEALALAALKRFDDAGISLEQLVCLESCLGGIRKISSLDFKTVEMPKGVRNFWTPAQRVHKVMEFGQVAQKEMDMQRQKIYEIEGEEGMVRLSMEMCDEKLRNAREAYTEKTAHKEALKAAVGEELSRCDASYDSEIKFIEQQFFSAPCEKRQELLQAKCNVEERRTRQRSRKIELSQADEAEVEKRMQELQSEIKKLESEATSWHQKLQELDEEKSEAERKRKEAEISSQQRGEEQRGETYDLYGDHEDWYSS